MESEVPTEEGQDFNYTMILPTSTVENVFRQEMIMAGSLKADERIIIREMEYNEVDDEWIVYFIKLKDILDA